MLQSRRGFLIGAGSLLTTAFVSDARSFIRRTGEPLLMSLQQAAQTIHWYDFDSHDGYLLSLGEWWDEPPPPPTWRQFFNSEGIPHQTGQEAHRIYDVHGIWPGQYDDLVDQDYWWSRCGYNGDPCFKAYELLSNINFGPKLGSARSPHLEFHGPGMPGGSSEWVTAKDKLSLSLLQARLIDLAIPIKIVQGTY